MRVNMVEKFLMGSWSQDLLEVYGKSYVLMHIDYDTIVI